MSARSAALWPSCWAYQARGRGALPKVKRMEERDYYLMAPRQKSLAISLPSGLVEALRCSAREMLKQLYPQKPRPEIAFSLEGMGALLHPLSLLPDSLQDVLLMMGRARFSARTGGMEAACERLLVGEGLAWIEVQVWRGENLELLTHELEEEDEGQPDELYREG
jgi:hypothetical protein